MSEHLAPGPNNLPLLLLYYIISDVVAALFLLIMHIYIYVTCFVSVINGGHLVDLLWKYTLWCSRGA